MIIEVVAALFVFLAVTGAALGVFRPVPVSRAAERRLDASRRPPARQGLDPGDVLRRGSSSLPPLRSLLSNSAWSERAAMDLQQAGLRLKVSEYLLLRLIVAAAAGLLAVLVIRGAGVGLFLTVPFAAIGFMLPAWYVRFRKEQRANTISQQLVETLQLVSNALRSGFAFTQALELAAKQMAPPIQDELSHFLRDNALGASTDEALRAMVQRAGSYDLDMAVTSILVQRTTGGNLAEILDNVAETMRERERIRAEIRGLTAHQRLTGTILSVYPAALALLLFAIHPTLMSVLWTDALGRIVLAIGGGLQLLGVFLIRRILAIDI